MINEFEGKLYISTRTVFQLPNYRTGYQLSYWLPAYVVGDESKYKAVTL